MVLAVGRGNSYTNDGAWVGLASGGSYEESGGHDRAHSSTEKPVMTKT